MDAIIKNSNSSLKTEGFRFREKIILDKAFAGK